MRNYANADHLHARICALRGRLLSLSDYAQLIRDQASAPALSDRDLLTAREKLFREQIAPLLTLAEAHDRYTPLFLAYLRQYEVRNVKVLFAKTMGRQTLQQWYDISPFACLDRETLAQNLSFDDIRSLCSGTYLSEAFEETSHPWQMATRLDALAARALAEASGTLSGQAKKDFQLVVFQRIALLAMIWSFRLRDYYRLSDEQIRSLMQKLKNVFGVPADFSARRLEEELNRYRELQLKSTGRKPSAAQIEYHLEKYFYTWVAAMFHRDFHSVFCMTAYLWLLFYQIRNLFCILDGRRFGLSSDVIHTSLICDA